MQTFMVNPEEGCDRALSPHQDVALVSASGRVSLRSVISVDRKRW